MDVTLRRPWIGLLVFFCVQMVRSETGETYGSQLKMDPKAITRILQVAMTDKKILDGMAKMAAKKNKALKGIKGFIGGNMEITMKTKMDIMIKMTKHPTKNIGIEKTGCELHLLAYKTNLPSNMLPKVLNKFLNSTLEKLLPGMMCPAADNVIAFMETKIEPMFEKKSFGESSTVWYEVAGEPGVLPDYNLIQLKVKFQCKNGEIVEVTPDPVLEDLPPKEEGKTAVYIPVSTINVAMMLMDGSFNSVITKIEGSTPTTDQLKEILPDADLPSGKDIKIEISPKVNATFTVSPTRSLMTIRIKVSFFSVEDGAELLSVDTVQECNASFTIKEEHLAVTPKTGSCSSTEISSPAGNVESAKDFMKTTMDGWIPHASGVLSKNQFPLPSLLGLMYSEGETTLGFGENVLLFHVKIEAFDENEMAERLRRYREAPKNM